jgi:glycosyltransferase involved in cell wall biosynthesis
MVSIITVCYNSAKTIEHTICSVKSQSFGDIQHIVIDGQSSDETLAILEKYPHLQVISERDQGIYDAMNKGIAMAKGDIIGILNSDDLYFDTTVVGRVVSAFQSPVNCVYGDLVYVAQTDTKKVVRIWKAGDYHAGSFRFGWMPPHPSFFVRKEVYQKYGVFDLRLPLAADYELMLRLIEKHKVSSLYIPYTFVRMRLGGVSNKNLKNLVRNYQENVAAWKYNNLPYSWYTNWLKRFRKIEQFLK